VRLPQGRVTAQERQDGKGPERGAAVASDALKGEAQGRSGASCAGRVGGGRREGGSQTPDVARGGAGTRRSYGSADPRLRRRAVKFRRGSIVRGAARLGGTVWACCDGPLKGRESAGGAPVGFGRPDVGSVITRRAWKRRTGWAEPMSALIRSDASPWSAAKPHERAFGPPQGELERSPQASSLWRALVVVVSKERGHLRSRSP
jgi:hypothetical protein